jgi:hypothetical protein
MKALIAAVACLIAQSFGLAQDRDAAPTTVKDLSWLVGRWTGVVKDAPTDQFGFTATTDGKFIDMNVEVRAGDRTFIDRYVYGFDPEKKTLTKWGFGADGSVSRLALSAASKKDELIWEGTYGSPSMPAAEARLVQKRIDADNLEVSSFSKGKKEPFVLRFRRIVIDRSTPKAVVAAAVEAMKKPDIEALHALMTTEWAAREKEWKKSFSAALLEGWKLVSAEIREPEVDGGTTSVSVKAGFKDAGGKDNGEGLRFVLVKKEGGWWISELK